MDYLQQIQKRPADSSCGLVSNRMAFLNLLEDLLHSTLDVKAARSAGQIPRGLLAKSTVIRLKFE